MVYLLCSVFLNNLWTREAPLICPSLRLIGCKLSGQRRPGLEQGFSPWSIWFPPPSPGVGRRGLGARQEGASSGGPSSWAPPLLAYLTLSPEPDSGNSSEECLIPKSQQGTDSCSSMRPGQGPQTQSGAQTPGSGPQDPVTPHPPSDVLFLFLFCPPHVCPGGPWPLQRRKRK